MAIKQWRWERWNGIAGLLLCELFLPVIKEKPIGLSFNTIGSGSFIHTDAWTGYWHLTEFFGYGHKMVNHELRGFDPTNRIENTWIRFRRFIRKTVARAWKEVIERIHGQKQP